MSERLDGNHLANSYAAARQRIATLLEGATSEQAATNVPTCPEWSVKDLASHNAGICVDLSGGNMPTDDVQGWIDRQVVERADHDISAVLAEWSQASPAFEAMIREHPRRFGSILIDVVTHEHDIAGALGLAAPRDEPSVELVIDLHQPMFEADLASNNLGAMKLVSPQKTWQAGDGAVELEVRASTWELFRMTGGRRSLSQLRASDHTGDIARYAPGLSHNPLPVTDIVE